MIEQVSHLRVYADVGEVPVRASPALRTHLELVSQRARLLTTSTHTAVAIMGLLRSDTQ